VIETFPFRVPVLLGAKATLIVQFSNDARVEPQLLVSTKFALAAMFAMSSVCVP